MNKKYERIMNQDEVNKAIMAKEKVGHSEYDLLNISGRYRDEDYEIYKMKRRQFYDSVRQYKGLNKMAMATNETKLEKDTTITYDFMNKISERFSTPHIPGEMIRKRTMRPIFKRMDDLIDKPKTSDAWFKRLLVLRKFICPVRVIILKNRMLKNLEKLKGLDRETISKHEVSGFKIENECYRELFEQFLHPSTKEQADQSNANDGTTKTDVNNIKVNGVVKVKSDANVKKSAKHKHR